MELKIPSGRYVIAVSGGVDSMSLLHILSRQAGVELVVAHFNHGIRADSRLDEELVRETALKQGHGLEIGYGRLGPGASEEKARDARYKFLRETQEKYAAEAIITAHQQDDLVETALLNLLRGSGRRGLSAISDSDIMRPLLNTPKTEVVKYAKKNKLIWREDETNQDTSYLRNYLRLMIMPKLTPLERKAIVNNLDKVAKTNAELNKQIATLSHNIKHKELINRAKYIKLPLEVADELMMLWLREYGVKQFDRKTISRLALAIKTARPSTSHAIGKDLRLVVGLKNAHFSTTD